MESELEASSASFPVCLSEVVNFLDYKMGVMILSKLVVRINWNNVGKIYF